MNTDKELYNNGMMTYACAEVSSLAKITSMGFRLPKHYLTDATKVTFKGHSRIMPT